MTLDWYLGIGDNGITFSNDRVTDALRNSPGIIKARNDYYSSSHKDFGHYNFGLPGLIQAGFDPILQFVGSYDYTIKIVGNNLQFTIKNQTSFASASYHLWPYSWNWTEGPMSNFTQTYIFTEPIRK